MVYRLITCGTVEEKIYRRQVFKGGLSRAGTRDEEQLRYFSYVVRRLRIAGPLLLVLVLLDRSVVQIWSTNLLSCNCSSRLQLGMSLSMCTLTAFTRVRYLHNRPV